MDEEMRDQFAASLAAMDQLKAFSKEVGALIGNYFAELLARGMERGEALVMVKDYQTIVVVRLFGLTGDSGDGQ